MYNKRKQHDITWKRMPTWKRRYKNIKRLGQLRRYDQPLRSSVVVTTSQNNFCSLLTSAKLLVGYLVVGITRELDKELSLHCYPIYTFTSQSVLQQCPTMSSVLKAICLPYVYSAVTVQDYASCSNVYMFYMWQQCGIHTL